jgi:hypothetical protein
MILNSVFRSFVLVCQFLNSNEWVGFVYLTCSARRRQRTIKHVLCLVLRHACCFLEVRAEVAKKSCQEMRVLLVISPASRAERVMRRVLMILVSMMR